MNWWKLTGIKETEIRGKVKVGRSTKELLMTMLPRHIAVIAHQDLDEMAANGLIEAKVKAVVNAAHTMSGKYPLSGPYLLMQAGIPIFEIQAEHMALFEDEMEITIKEEYIHTPHNRIKRTVFTENKWRILMIQAEDNLGAQLSAFIDNTLHYAKQEKDFVIQSLPIPKLQTVLAHKHVVVVVRGSNYKNDLYAIKDYIEDYKPVLIGVDGGADALLEYGYTPNLIIGDMDSIADSSLHCGAEIIVHAYPDGRAPGMERVESLDLKAKSIAALGTSEDIAMLLAFEENAELIVTIGAHTHMIDFLQKGRKGMSSTMLVRMKIGEKLIDAKGVSKLYHRPVRWRNLWFVPVAGCFPLVMLGFIHPGLRHFVDVMWMYIKLSIS